MGRFRNRFPCWVCRRFYTPDNLGRCQLPKFGSAKATPFQEVVCRTCYAAVVDSFVRAGAQDTPVLHGF